MTVKQLYDELGQLIKEGYGDTRVIANCEFNITKGNGYYNDFPLSHLKDVYYQSSDIELDFSQEEEFTEENKYKNDNNGWHDLVANPNDLPNDGEFILASNLCTTEYVKFRKEKDGNHWRQDYFELCDVVYWKEIIPPKE